ncbi:PEP-CTERM sorting domain-containing protein [Luteolibacter algae]|uniref:PEP-CTERM sorting domain-containing protein n=1 Tax=Luteolibacter algae TaxID=454151 RepID=A0ABW5D7A3_9BACT
MVGYLRHVYSCGDLAVGNAVGGITNRWNADPNNNNIANNGATDTTEFGPGGRNNFTTDFLGGSQQVRLAGVYSNSYTGNIPTGLDPNRPATPTANKLLFNINFQNGTPTDNVVYFDNFVFSVDTVPEPSAALLAALGAIGFGMIRRRR